MTVLIVDDLQVVLSGIYFGVHWNDIGIDNVQTARSAQEARSVFARHTVDILLCDIDMPGEDGLSLFSWVKEQGYDTECIFLTSHDNFVYVKKAFLLGSFDYILQPARYDEIEQAIGRVLSHMREKQVKNKYESYGKLFFSEIDAMKKSLFQGWYHQQITFAQFLEKLRSFQLSPDTCHGLYLLLADAPGATKEGQLLCSYVPKYITDYLFPEKYLHLEAELSDSRQLYFFYPAAGTDFPCSRMKDCVQSLYEHARPLFQTALSFYLTQVEPCSDSQRLCTLAEEALVQIRTAAENNVSLASGVFYPSAAADTAMHKVIPSLPVRRLTELVSQGELGEFSRVCKTFLQTLAQTSALSGDSLRVFRFTLLQVLYKTLDSGTVSPDSLAALSESEPLNHNLKNIADANAFVDCITGLLEQFVEPPKNHNHVDRIISYIQEHIDEPLRRTDIAAAVYLTPDYVTKIFKEKVGISLKEYILKEKINVARDRLRTTDLSIEEVALRGGFTNFSYFSQLYKKYTGITPKKERSKMV